MKAVEVQKTVQDRLVELRHTQALETQNELLKKEHLHERRKEVYICGVILLDPERKVAAKWKKTPYDHITNIKVDDSRKPGERIDAGDGWGVISKAGGPYRIRHLQHPRIGEVEEVDALTYRLARSGVETRPENARHEPVPDDVPVCKRICSPSMPTDYAKAKRLAAKGLKKEEAVLTFKEVVKYFWEKSDSREVFRG